MTRKSIGALGMTADLGQQASLSTPGSPNFPDDQGIRHVSTKKNLNALSMELTRHNYLEIVFYERIGPDWLGVQATRNQLEH